MLALAMEEERRALLAASTLLEFIPRVSPQYDAPVHIAPFAHWIDRAATEPVRLLVSMPPQSYKTTTSLHGLVHHMLRVPGKAHMYITYSQQRAEQDIQPQALAIAHAAGLELVKATNAYWRCANGSTIRWLGIGGRITGLPGSGVIFIDDLYKDMTMARSAAHRKQIESVWGSAIWPRLHPGASIIALGTRWTLDDFFAERQATVFPSGQNFEVINYPAIWPDGSPLLPHRPDCEPGCQKHRDLAFLADKKAGMSPYEWEAEYMGNPRPEGMMVFKTPLPVCHEAPRSGIRYAVGLDLADTEKTSADYNAAVVLASWVGWDPRINRTTTLYCVLEVLRAQCLVSDFAKKLVHLKERYPTATFFTFYGGQEKTVIREVLNREPPMGFGLNVKGRPALVDKLARATPASAASHADRLMVPPGNPPWLKPFLHEVERFTGTEADKHDDQVDALAAAHHVLSHGDNADHTPPRLAQRVAENPSVLQEALLEELAQRASAMRG